MRVLFSILGVLLIFVAALMVSCGGGRGVVATPSSAVTVSSVDDLTASAGEANPELANELTFELEKQLKKVAHLPPGQPKPLVWWIPQTRTLYWVLAGDYNINGTVDIADITPVAIFFGNWWSFPTTEVVPWWVDGNASRRVDIADITPIAVHFFKTAPPHWDILPGGLTYRQVEDKAMWALEVPTRLNWWEIEISPGLPPPPPNQPPVASLVVSPISGVAPLLVALNASGSTDSDGTIVRYDWDFDGDGVFDSDGTGSIASHPYSAGTYVPRVRVTDNEGATDIAVATSTITVEPAVENQPPVALFTASPTSGEAPLTVEFDASNSYDPDGDTITYQWVFEDGYSTNYSTSPLTSHTYVDPGDYEPKLTVKDSHGDMGFMTVMIIVIEPEPPPTYELFVLGTDGPLYEGGTLVILEGTSKLLNIWQLRGSDGSTVELSRSDIVVESQLLPFWVFSGFAATGEVATVLWANPDNPDPDDPGNMFIEPGSYGVTMSVSYESKVYVRSWTLVVEDRPDFP